MFTAGAFRRVVARLYSPRWLVVTNTATGVVSITLGDVLQQHIEHRLDQGTTNNNNNNNNNAVIQWDHIRTRNMAAAGVYFSLFGHWWYTFLDRKFPPKARNAVRNKIFAEMVMGPILVTSVFGLMGTLRGHSVATMWRNVVSNFVIICNVEWLVYIPLQWLNFRFVPMQYRYLYVATISLGYDAFLSYVLHRNERANAIESKSSHPSSSPPPSTSSVINFQ